MTSDYRFFLLVWPDACSKSQGPHPVVFCPFMCVRVKVLGSHNYPCFCMGPCSIALTPFVPFCVVYILFLSFWVRKGYLCDCCAHSEFQQGSDFLSSAVPLLVTHSAQGNAPVPAPLTHQWIKYHREYYQKSLLRATPEYLAEKWCSQRPPLRHMRSWQFIAKVCG